MSKNAKLKDTKEEVTENVVNQQEEAVKDTQEKVKVVTQQQENELLSWINEIPTKYGLPLIRFLQGLKTK